MLQPLQEVRELLPPGRLVVPAGIPDHGGEAGAGAGLHLVVWLRPDLDETQIAQQAVGAGVGVYPLGRFRLGAMERPGLLLGFAALDEVEITEGVRRLAAVIRDGSRQGGLGTSRQPCLFAAREGIEWS